MMNKNGRFFTFDMLVFLVLGSEIIGVLWFD